MTDLLAVAAATWGVAMAVALLQIRAILVHRTSRAVSLGYQPVLLVGFLLWLAYGIALHNAALIVPNTVAAVISIATIAVTLRFRHAEGVR